MQQLNQNKRRGQSSPVLLGGYKLAKKEEKIEKKLEEHINLGISLNVQGTPALFDKDGNSIVWVNLLEKYGIEFK